MKVGDKVVCIDDSLWRPERNIQLIKDKIYVILEIGALGAVDVNGDCYWCPERFKPLEPKKFKNKLTQELAIKHLTTQVEETIEHIEIKETV